VQETGASGLEGIFKNVGGAMLTDQDDLPRFQAFLDCPICIELPSVRVQKLSEMDWLSEEKYL
jgi:hypothetical protein